MINVKSTDVIRIVTDATTDVDVHADFVDRNTSTNVDTPGAQSTKITSSTTTTVVSSPSSGTVRNVRQLWIRNVHASASVTVTLQHYDGSTAYEIDKRTLAAGTGWPIGDG